MPMPQVSESMDAPHHPLRGYYPREEERGLWIRELFDHTAIDYERIARLVGLGSGSWYRRQALRRGGLRPGMTILDVGVGTGLLTCEAARLVGDPSLVVGLDPSVGMIRTARTPAGVKLAVGCAERIPAAPGAFDFVSMGYVLRYLGSISQAFAEIYRVLTPGGRICILEMGRPANRLTRAAWSLYIKGVVPLLTRIVARDPETLRLVRYLWDTIDRSIAPSAGVIALERAGFADVRCEIDLGIFATYFAAKPVP